MSAIMTKEDKGKLTEKDTAELNAIAKKINSCESEQAALVLRCGKLLFEGQELLQSRGCKSEFGRWVEDNFNFSLRLAQYRIKAHLCFLDVNDETVARFDITALYNLSDNGNDEARHAALEIAGDDSLPERERRITTRRAKSLISKHSKKADESGDSNPKYGATPVRVINTIISAAKKSLGEEGEDHDVLQAMSDSYSQFEKASCLRWAAAEAELQYESLDEKLEKWLKSWLKDEYPSVTAEEFHVYLEDAKQHGVYEQAKRDLDDMGLLTETT